MMNLSRVVLLLSQNDTCCTPVKPDKLGSPCCYPAHQPVSQAGSQSPPAWCSHSSRKPPHPNNAAKGDRTHPTALLPSLKRAALLFQIKTSPWWQDKLFWPTYTSPPFCKSGWMWGRYYGVISAERETLRPPSHPLSLPPAESLIKLYK